MSNWPLHDGARYEGFGIATGGSSGLVEISSHASANTKGSYTELNAATAFAYEGIELNVQPASNASDDSLLIDLAIGGAGAEVVVVPDLLVDVGSRTFKEDTIRFPLAIPAGSRLSARCAASAGSTDARIGGRGWQTGFASPWFVGNSAVVAMGVDAADTAGTQVDPGGTANTKGAWSEIEDSTPRDFATITIAIGQQRNGGPGNNGMLFDIGVGAAGSEAIVIPDINYDVREIFSVDVVGPALSGYYPVQIPAGSRLAVRAQSFTTDAADRLKDVVLYGVVA